MSTLLSHFPCRLGVWRVLASSPLETLLSLFWGSSRDLDIRLLVAPSLQQSPADSSFCDCCEWGLCLLQRIEKQISRWNGLRWHANAFVLAKGRSSQKTLAAWFSALRRRFCSKWRQVLESRALVPPILNMSPEQIWAQHTTSHRIQKILCPMPFLKN